MVSNPLTHSGPLQPTTEMNSKVKTTKKRAFKNRVDITPSRMINMRCVHLQTPEIFFVDLKGEPLFDQIFHERAFIWGTRTKAVSGRRIELGVTVEV